MGPEKARAARRPRGRPSRGVRDAILSAVRDLIREHGIASVTMGAVAQRAAASEASIHYHFGGKERLVESAILGALEPLRNQAWEASAVPGRPLGESLAELASALESFYDELIPVLAAVQSDPQLRRETAPKLALHDLGPHRAISLVARHIKANQPQGESGAPGDVEAAALLLVGACFLRAWQRQMSTHRSRALPGLHRAVNVLLHRETGYGRSKREP